jgi:hypothetical protein
MIEVIIGGNDLIAAISNGVFEIDIASSIETTDVLSESPAAIIAQFLIDEGIMTVPENDDLWPLYISMLPSLKGDCGAIYDTQGTKDGKQMRGKYVGHPGVMIKIRSEEYITGWDKINDIGKALDVLTAQEVTIDDASFVIKNVSRIGDIGKLGIEPETRKNLFSLNCICCIEEIT